MEKIVQITAGRGPVECMYVVSKILKLFLKACNNAKIEAQVTQRVSGSQTNTLVSAIVLAKGKSLEAFLDTWQGSILWVCKSPYRKFHKRKNWFIGVFEMEQNSIKKLNQKDITYEAIRSSGPGGQHVNKVSSAIRATHLPTGISVKVMDTRSQIQNKKLAKLRLEKAWDEPPKKYIISIVC